MTSFVWCRTRNPTFFAPALLPTAALINLALSDPLPLYHPDQVDADMAYYYGAQQQHHQPGNSHSGSHNNHHGGRSRRAPRVSSQNSHRQFRGARSMKELTDAPTFSVFRQRFDLSKGFEIDDDLEFCPGLLTEDDVRDCDSSLAAAANTDLLDQISSISSSSSDRSSLASNSPSSSPTQTQAHPTSQISPPFSLAQAYQPNQYNSSHHSSNQRSQPSMKIHQPSALRTRSAIPIVDPTTMQRVASPPQSISPARMQQQTYLRRAW